MKYLLIALTFISCSKSSDIPTPTYFYSDRYINISPITTVNDNNKVKFSIIVSGEVANVGNIRLFKTTELATGKATYTITPVVAGTNIAYDVTNTTYNNESYNLQIYENGTFYTTKPFSLN